MKATKYTKLLTFVYHKQFSLKVNYDKRNNRKKIKSSLINNNNKSKLKITEFKEQIDKQLN